MYFYLHVYTGAIEPKCKVNIIGVGEVVGGHGTGTIMRWGDQKDDVAG